MDQNTGWTLPAGDAALDALGITHDRHASAVFTAEDASHWDPIPGTQCKNLFLRNKKGDRHYLVVVEIGKRVDLKDLVKIVDDDRLSFGSPERLMAKLGLTPGSVSPFGLIHDSDASVRVLIDQDLRGAGAADLPSEHQHGERCRRGPTERFWRPAATVCGFRRAAEQQLQLSNWRSRREE